ncbi:hypothetical protein ACFFGV_10015 [Pontibacillus salicampi]|uniref:Uncharacterized protein n=1 Tax=Pontibacillus salicampi TaxID=1449801 RepID=A0ABV6LNK0_9BACI
MNEPTIHFPNNLFDSATVEGTCISSMDKSLGVVILSANEPITNDTIVSVFSLDYDSLQDVYNVDKELEHFRFFDYANAKQFINHLPHMSAIDLMRAMNLSVPQS